MVSPVVYVSGGVLLLTYFVVGSRFDDCRVAPAITQFELNKFESNSPRKDEVIRSKVYFKTMSPYISVSGSDHRLVFGKTLKFSGHR